MFTEVRKKNIYRGICKCLAEETIDELRYSYHVGVLFVIICS